MTPKIRTLVVDDEPLARERVRALLQQHPDVEVIGECGDGAEALEAIRRDRPALVFLDIQMPEMDGLTLVSELTPKELPAIVFITAYDQYAVRAFEVHALDYLLKPFDDERFEAALARARARLKGTEPTVDFATQLQELLAELRPAPKPLDRIAVKEGGRVLLLRMQDIDWVEAADNYVSLHVAGNAHLLRETMSSLEQRLPAELFLRISRSTIVNLDRVKELQPLFHGEQAVILRDGTRLTLSRGYRDKLAALLGKDS